MRPCGYFNPVHFPLPYSESHACHALLAAVTNNMQWTCLVNTISPLLQRDQQISRTWVQVRLLDGNISLSPGKLSLLIWLEQLSVNSVSSSTRRSLPPQRRGPSGCINGRSLLPKAFKDYWRSPCGSLFLRCVFTLNLCIKSAVCPDYNKNNIVFFVWFFFPSLEPWSSGVITGKAARVHF